MRRILETVVGIALLGVACWLAVGAVASQGAVTLEWPLAAIILGLATVGGRLVSKSLMLDIAKAAGGVWRKGKEGGP